MIEAFRAGVVDIHARTASEVFGVRWIAWMRGNPPPRRQSILASYMAFRVWPGAQLGIRQAERLKDYIAYFRENFPGISRLYGQDQARGA